VGQLIADADVRIVMDGSEVPFGTEGEIWVNGPFVFPGYHNKPAETQEAFADLHGRNYFRVRGLFVLCPRQSVGLHLTTISAVYFVRL
jgi:acyl-CoA synthetase (AMP-forming)/AMP-acid ligase II